MKRVATPFQFSFPLNHKVVRNLKIVNEHVGDLQVEGSVTINANASVLSHLDERFAVDVDYIKWNGTDIKPVLELTGLMEDVQEAALRHCAARAETTLRKAA